MRKAAGFCTLHSAGFNDKSNHRPIAVSEKACSTSIAHFGVTARALVRRTLAPTASPVTTASCSAVCSVGRRDPAGRFRPDLEAGGLHSLPYNRGRKSCVHRLCGGVPVPSQHRILWGVGRRHATAREEHPQIAHKVNVVSINDETKWICDLVVIQTTNKETKTVSNTEAANESYSARGGG